MKASKGTKGFSLIELVIVVVIIGIIGAIAIPRMSRGASGAADSSLKANLAVLRNAIDLYHAEHGKYPTLGQMQQADPSQHVLLTYTNIDGLTSPTPTATHVYGPYLRTIPPLPVGPNQGSTSFNSTLETGPASSTTPGWYYNAVNGDIRANTGDLLDTSKSRLYSSY